MTELRTERAFPSPLAFPACLQVLLTATRRGPGLLGSYEESRETVWQVLEPTGQSKGLAVRQAWV